MKKFLLTSAKLNLDVVRYLFNEVGFLPNQQGTWWFAEFEYKRCAWGYAMTLTFVPSNKPGTVTFAELWRNRWPSATQ